MQAQPERSDPHLEASRVRLSRPKTPSPFEGEAASAAQGGHLNLGMLNFNGTPMRLLMNDC